MFFASSVLLLSSYVSPSLAGDTTVEQMGITYGESMEEMMVTFASFSALDETAECSYGTDASDLRYPQLLFLLVHAFFVIY
jgi:hypothetical protein